MIMRQCFSNVAFNSSSKLYLISSCYGHYHRPMHMTIRSRGIKINSWRSVCFNLHSDSVSNRIQPSLLEDFSQGRVNQACNRSKIIRSPNSLNWNNHQIYTNRIIRTYSTSTNVNTLCEKLRSVVGTTNVTIAESIRFHHGKDESYHAPQLPEVVAFPANTEEVSSIAKICTEMKVPMVPFGTGTGMEGGCVCTHGGVSVDLSRMADITEYKPEDLSVCVQPGVTRLTLNEYMRGDGLWFPVDPGADASLCGMAATSASGTNAVRYGTMRENVSNLEVVLPDGTIIYTAGQGRHTTKSSAGYNLTNLFVGTEGTLGFITSATLRLHGIPESISSAVCQFNDVESAVSAVQQVLLSGVSIARIELLNSDTIRAVNSYSKLTFEEKPSLFLEFHGSEQQTKEEAGIVDEIFTEAGGLGFQWASDAAERNKLWKARHNTLYAILATRKGSQVVQISTDVCVPISQLTKAITDTEEDLLSHGVTGYILGHVGDGNYHATFLYDTADEEEKFLVDKLSERIVERAQKLNGTCTGEHGVGSGKRKYMLKEFGQGSLNLMKQIKGLIDPHGLMNPGKVLP